VPSTSRGLVYPDSSGNVQIWTHLQNLAESADAAIATASAAWTSWTPTWDTSGGGGFTSVGGSGTNQGFYRNSDGLVHAEFRIELASGFAVDTGTFVLVLPVTAYASWGGVVSYATLGNWEARNNSDPYHYGGPLAMWDAAGTKVHFGGSWDGSSPRSRIDSNDPIVWASGDVLSGNLNYRAA
jgi:hypothetical protein